MSVLSSLASVALLLLLQQLLLLMMVWVLKVRVMMTMLAALSRMLLLLLLLSSSCSTPSSVLRLFLPGLYTKLLSLPVLKLLGSYTWLQSLLLWSVMLVAMLSLCAVLPSMLVSGLLWLLQGACSSLCFVVGFALLLPILAALASSCAWRLYGLALVISVASDGLGNVATIDKGGGSVGS